MHYACTTIISTILKDSLYFIFYLNTAAQKKMYLFLLETLL